MCSCDVHHCTCQFIKGDMYNTASCMIREICLTASVSAVQLTIKMSVKAEICLLVAIGLVCLCCTNAQDSDEGINLLREQGEKS